MTLRKRAEAAAKELFARHDGFLCKHAYCSIRSDAADAIERVAIEFAEKAVRAHARHDCTEHGSVGSWYDCVHMALDAAKEE